MVKVKEYCVSHFRAEGFIGSFTPSTFNICYGAFSGEEMTLAAYGKSFISGVETKVKITTFVCSLQPNKKIKAGKRLIAQPFI